MRAPHLRPIVIAAGGTGGHFFPAAALSDALATRGHRVVLMTDARTAARADTVAQGAFEQRLVLRGAGIAGRGKLRAAGALVALAIGTLQARRLLARLNAACVVGFGGYPAVPPVLAAASLGLPSVLHEQNAVLGRANRFLARRATALALSFERTERLPAGIRRVLTGNPVRRAIVPAPYVPPADTLRILVLGGSLGARVMSDVVPAALAGLALPAGLRLQVTQQCRAEDLNRVRAAYVAAGIQATLASFLDDVPTLLRESHLVIARAGASTVAEIAVVGRPAVLIPLPGAIDDHQAANARQLGAACLPEPVPPEALRATIDTLLRTPDALPAMAGAIAAAGRPDAAAQLADLVVSCLPADILADEATS
jgi:UDP-N-acetylglucosamine--N-acetylmuramyl-(pentapeptide) pyrophosphoryl-undecaprenol N-acetylglucosamine transferase